MVSTHYIAPPALLLQALLKDKHLKRTKRTDPPPAAVPSSCEDVSPRTRREGLVREP